MRIAVYHNLPSGGGKRALFEVLKRISRMNYVDVFTTSSAEHTFCDIRPCVSNYRIYPFKPTRLLGFPLRRLNPLIRILDLLRLDALQHVIAEAINKEQYDLVFVHNCYLSQTPSILRHLRKKSVFYSGEPPRGFTEPQIDRSYFNKSSFKRVIDKMDPLPNLYRRILLHFDRSSALAATKVLVNSAYSRENFYRVYGQFASICYLGVDNEKFHPLGIKREPFVFSVGALRPNKGFDFLIESLALVPADKRPKLIIACNIIIKSEKCYLEDLAKRHGVQMEIREMITDEELVRLYNQALLTLYAPVMEPFGFVPLESMACGTPIIGVNEAGVRESIVNNVVGLLVEREPRSMAQAIQYLISSNNLLETMGSAGRKNVLDNWGWDSCSKRLNELFHSTLCFDK